MIIVLCLIYSVSSYFAAMRKSYDKYLEGEYFFSFKATTISAHTSSDWTSTSEIPGIDNSDQKVNLICTAGSEVYAADPHNGICTVYYNDNVIKDFPVSNLRFANDGADHFYGTKTYTYEEYIDVVKNADEDGNLQIGDKHMADFEHAKIFIYGIIGLDVVLAIVLFSLYTSGKQVTFDLVVFLGALCNILYDLITSFMAEIW